MRISRMDISGTNNRSQSVRQRKSMVHLRNCSSWFRLLRGARALPLGRLRPNLARVGNREHPLVILLPQTKTPTKGGTVVAKPRTDRQMRDVLGVAAAQHHVI